jgi:hypothetical protein
MNLSPLERDGFIEVAFPDRDSLAPLRELVAASFPCPPTAWHERGATQEEHIDLVRRVTEIVAESDLVRALVRTMTSPLAELLGPSIDVQRVPHLRVSRPSTESDFVGIHRDTFYGNTPYEMNLWFPLYPLHEGAGLCVLPGSHATAARDVRVEEDQDPFRRTVEKGSAANEIGYTYSPKSDETIRSMRPRDLRLLAPDVGHGVLFFGHLVHRAQNESIATRVTIDVRLKSAHAPTGTRSGYYQPLCRGIVDACAERQREER